MELIAQIIAAIVVLFTFVGLAVMFWLGGRFCHRFGAMRGWFAKVLAVACGFVSLLGLMSLFDLTENLFVWLFTL